MTPPDQILFLCTGNYYRSRYAEEVFNFRARVEGLSWRAFSRGLAERSSPENVGPMSRFTLDALRARTIAPDGAQRFPMPCSPADFDQAALVIALKDAEHRPMVERRFPQVATRIEYWHVDDIEFAPPEVALAMIDREVEELILRLQSQGIGGHGRN
jgi:protein-tyrosine phosphatase